MPASRAWAVFLLLVAAVYAPYITQESFQQSEPESETYTPFDRVVIRIFSPDSNQNHNAIESIRVLISSSLSQKQFSLPETGPNTSVFEDDIQLSPDLSKFPGDIEVRREDGLSVTFRIDEDTVVTQSIKVNYHVSKAFFDKPSYGPRDEAKVTVEDRDMNRNPNTIDTLSVRVWSETDRGGLLLTLRETGARTGIFEEFIRFTLDEESTGNRLRVSDGDTITVKYTDSTLPPPAKLAADGVETVEVQEIFGSSVFGELVPITERAAAAEPSLVNLAGETVSQISAGEQVLIQSEVTNAVTKKQPFVYLVMVKDAGGITVSLSWITAELPPSESLKVAQSWIPHAPGDYSIEIFVWLSLAEPTPLGPSRIMNIEVI